MVPRFARPVLEAPITRVKMRVDSAIEGLYPYGRSALWGEALAATLALSRATTHLLRAQLVLLGNLAAGGPGEGAQIERFATGVELLHLFMLVHDDVMDNATLRRGKPTLRVALTAVDPTLGTRKARDLAIVVGSLLNVQAIRCLTPGPGGAPGETEAAALVLEACCRAGAGQFHDLLGLRGLGDDEEALRRELVDKAAYHAFVAPFAAGVLLSRPGADLDLATAWGCHLGLAYQGADDLADLAGSPATTGKDSLRDLLEGRASLPLLFLRRRATLADRDFLDGLAARHAMEIGERVTVDGLVRAYRVVEACAEWVRVEVAAAARVREAAGFTGEASLGMAAIESGLVAYLDTVVASAQSPDADDDA
jgi:geranylgeranyl diphosphate synthase type I